jgi:transposase
LDCRRLLRGDSARSARVAALDRGTCRRSYGDHARQRHAAIEPGAWGPERGARAGWDGHKRRKGSKIHLAVDTLGHLLALHVTPAHAQERAQVGLLAEAVQDVTGETVELAFVDQGDTGPKPAAAAAAQGIQLTVVKLPNAQRGFVLLPRRWVVERSFAWTTRFRRLARDYERLPETVEGLSFVACACLMLQRLLTDAMQSP